MYKYPNEAQAMDQCLASSQGKAVYVGGPDRQLKPLSDNNTVLVPEAHRHRLCLQR